MKDLKEALTDYGFSSRPLVTYTIKPVDWMPEFEVEIYRTGEGTDIIDTPSSSQRDAVESALRDLTDLRVEPKESAMIELSEDVLFDIID